MSSPTRRILPPNHIKYFDPFSDTPGIANPLDTTLVTAQCRLVNVAQQINAESPDTYRRVARYFEYAVAQGHNATTASYMEWHVKRGKVDVFVQWVRWLENIELGIPHTHSCHSLWKYWLPQLPGEDDTRLEKTWFERIIAFAYWYDHQWKQHLSGIRAGGGRGAEGSSRR